MELSWFQFAVLVVAGSMLLYAVFLGLGGRAHFGTRERPERLIGRRVQLFQLESGPKGVDPDQPELPLATVEFYSPNEGYHLKFETPVKWLEKTEEHAIVSARHVGYPVSLASSTWRRGVYVHGSFGSGEPFIGAFRLIRNRQVH